MKILQVIPYFVPAYSYGGPVKVCFDISKELVKRGHNATVVTTDALDNKNRVIKLREKIDGVEIVRFRNVSNWLAKNYNGYLPIGFFFWIKKNIGNYDAVHCHDFFTLQNIITTYFCKKYNVPFVIQPHGTLSPVRQEARFKTLKKLFTKLFTGVSYNARNVIALTENEKNEILLINKHLGDKIKVIPNGLRLEEFQNIDKIDLSEKYVLPKENKIIGYIGRIQYIKGIDLSLEILARLKNKLNFTYLIIGPDEGEKNKLKKKIVELGLQDNVVFAGILDGKEKLKVINSCDLFLFTSRNEGLPMTILEVASLGIPQLLSENCNVPEIEEFNAGKVIPLKEIQNFEKSLEDILSDKNKTTTMSENSKKMVQEKFDLNKVCDKLENIYKN